MDSGIVGGLDDDPVPLPVIGHTPERHANPMPAIGNQTEWFDGFILDGKGNPLIHRDDQSVCRLTRKGIRITHRAGQRAIANKTKSELRLDWVNHNLRLEDQT